MTSFDLLKSKIDYQILFENSNDGILIHDLDLDQIIAINSRCLDLLDRTESEVLLKSPKVFLPAYQSDGRTSTERLEKVIDETLQNKKGSYERIHYRKDGTLVWFHVNTYLMPSTENHLLVVVYRDITKLRQQQATIATQNQNLVHTNEALKRYIESNADLENFAYIAAHDLQSPTKTMMSFSSLLIESVQDQDYEELEELAQYIFTAAENMNDLVHNLLIYSKAKKSEHKVQTFDLKSLMASLIIELDSLIKEKKATIEVEGMPEVFVANKVKIRQVFQNLVINAIKFQKATVPCRIKVTGQDKGDTWQFEVKDNGIGVKKEYFAKVFQMFQRLNPSSKYKGSGIGLALCQNIIEQHEGKIWLKSEYGVGTSFYFSIPK